MAIPLQKEEMNALREWIGGNIKLTLQYKISRDGCNAWNFHTKCDGKGPTVTVIYNTKDTVYGGYTSQNWNSTYSTYYAYDQKAFLFQVRKNGKSMFKKYPIKADKYANAILCGHNLGPIFGGGNDVYPFSGNVDSSNGVYKFNSCTLNHTYDMKGDDITAFADNVLEMKDMEVYQIDEGMFEPHLNYWRITPNWDKQYLQTLRKDVEEYCPLEETCVDQVKALLIGQVAAGKSSFFNTINSIFKGAVTSQANSGSTEKSLTTKFRMYQVRKGRSGKPLNFRLCDTRGLEKDEGIDPQELCYILDGNMPDKYTFNSSTQLSSDTPGFIKLPSTKDKIHIVVIVMDATSVDVLPDEIIQKIKSLQVKINQRGIPQVVLLTKIDKVCEALQRDVSRTFCIPVISELVEKVASMVGLPRAHIIPIKNYESEMELREDINILALLALRQILNFADDYLTNFLDE